MKLMNRAVLDRIRQVARIRQALVDDLREENEAIERREIERQLHESHGNIAKAARKLNLNTASLRERIRRYSIRSRHRKQWRHAAA